MVGNPGLPNGWFPNTPETLTVEQLPVSPLSAGSTNGRFLMSPASACRRSAAGGPAAKVKCGKGKDTVRYSHNERRRIKGCERRYSIK